MELKALFLAQLEHEAIITRKAVERVPEGHNDWKPHAKSMEMGRLAALVATLTWVPVARRCYSTSRDHIVTYWCSPSKAL